MGRALVLSEAQQIILRQLPELISDLDFSYGVQACATAAYIQ